MQLVAKLTIHCSSSGTAGYAGYIGSISATENYDMIMASNPGGMNNEQLDALIHRLGTDVDGQAGFWQFTVFGVRLYCITDESHDRLRVMTPIVDATDLDSAIILKCMEANYDRALDARYCINDGTLWSAFIHPLRSLNAEFFRSGCSQVAELSRNFGTTYSSGELRFGGDPD